MFPDHGSIGQKQTPRLESQERPNTGDLSKPKMVPVSSCRLYTDGVGASRRTADAPETSGR
eukprot:8163732-Pyramimonas_sp.AAC.1